MRTKDYGPRASDDASGRLGRGTARRQLATSTQLLSPLHLEHLEHLCTCHRSRVPSCHTYTYLLEVSAPDVGHTRHATPSVVGTNRIGCFLSFFLDLQHAVRAPPSQQSPSRPLHKHRVKQAVKHNECGGGLGGVGRYGHEHDSCYTFPEAMQQLRTTWCSALACGGHCISASATPLCVTDLHSKNASLLRTPPSRCQCASSESLKRNATLSAREGWGGVRCEGWGGVRLHVKDGVG